MAIFHGVQTDSGPALSGSTLQAILDLIDGSHYEHTKAT